MRCLGTVHMPTLTQSFGSCCRHGDCAGEVSALVAKLRQFVYSLVSF